MFARLPLATVRPITVGLMLMVLPALTPYRPRSRPKHGVCLFGRGRGSHP